MRYLMQVLGGKHKHGHKNQREEVHRINASQPRPQEFTILAAVESPKTGFIIQHQDETRQHKEQVHSQVAGGKQRIEEFRSRQKRFQVVPVVQKHYEKRSNAAYARKSRQILCILQFSLSSTSFRCGGFAADEN